MKKSQVLKIILIIIGLLFLTVGAIVTYFLIKSNTPENYEEWKAPDDMINATTFHETTIEIQEGSLTNTSATFIIKTPHVGNPSYVGFSTDDYRLFKKVFGKWKELIPLDINATRDVPLGKEQSKDGVNIEYINWEKDYGSLNKGIYKLSIRVLYSYFGNSTPETDSGYIGVEFEIK